VTVFELLLMSSCALKFVTGKRLTTTLRASNAKARAQLSATRSTQTVKTWYLVLPSARFAAQPTFSNLYKNMTVQ